MSKDPAFLFYHQDFFSGVSDMTNEEIGAYVKCLCIQASKGGITEKHMLIICYSYEVHNIVKNKFVFNEETNMFENIRLRNEIEKRKKYSESRSNNRKKGLQEQKSKKDMLIISKSYDNHMENENEIENEIKDEVKNVILNEDIYINLLLEYGFDKNLILEWFVVRKNKNVTNSTTFFKGFIKTVSESGIDKNEVLKICVENSWATFKKTWYDNLNKTNTNGTATAKKANVQYSDDFLGKIANALQS